MTVYANRLAKIRRAMVQQNLDLLFLPPSSHMYYATGIHEQPYFPIMKVPADWLTGVLIGLEGAPLFLAHWMLARHASMDEPTLVESHPLADGADVNRWLRNGLARFGTVKRLGVADQTWARAVESFRTALPNAAIVTAGGFLDELLAIKDQEALRRMRHAAAITDAAHPDVLKQLRLGMTVRDVALEVDFQLRRHGADDNSFQTGIVFTSPDGPPSAPDRELLPGDSITFDYGCRAWGYSSDFGRAAFAGEPPADYRTIHATVLAAQAAGMAAMKAGQITCAQADVIARRVIEEAGYGPYFTHRLGHGIGVKVHERPFLDGVDPTVLQEGMTFTVEPSIRVPNTYANRVEDVVLVTKEGGVFLNDCPRDLYVIE